MSNIHRLLVPTDFSPASDIALQYAIDMAKRLGSQIHLLHVIDGANFGAAYPDGIYIEIPGLRERLIQESTDQLRKAAGRCEGAGLMTTLEVIVGGPARAIAKTATSRATDLIVMGTHGRGAIAHLVLGSVAEQVVRIAPCAVLTVRDTSRIADVIAGAQVAATNVAQST